MQNVGKYLRLYFLASCFLSLTLLAGGGYQAVHAQSEDDLALLDRASRAFSSVVEKAGPAVVHVAVEKTTTARSAGPFPPDLFSDPFFERFFGPHFRHPRQPQQEPRNFRQRTAGSGFIIAEDGYILTNNHVIDGAEKITVRLADQREYTAEIIGADPQSDVAVIKIDGSNLPTLKLGDSDALKVGEWVIAIGSPFELTHTVTVGVVSAKGRNRVGITDYENFIQTDAAINPGNSGGPLLNIHGEAVGMNTAIFSRSGGYMGIGFAIPINMAKNIEQQLRTSGKVTRGWLGVLIQDVNEDMARSFGHTKAGGALISEVTKDSPAEKNGLKQGDIILAIDGLPVANVADLRNKIAMTPPATKLTLRVLREGKEHDLAVTVGEQPADIAALAQQIPSKTLNEVGLTLQDLTPEIAEQFGYTPDQGVLIADVEQGSPAAMARLQAGHLIEEVNRIRVRNLEELEEAMTKAATPNRVLLRVRAGEQSRFVVLQTD
ncbi:DegQ family serine endoprotease [Desulfobulbus alkaliphilus]|uniref:DegQ family serine endoprotease n=1 Tax=Desulfobulbus alkaliphilus TaxID=869814 RepID=UPI00196644DF|nr:DegQ family serine endoprotease [Desulfobulbus alkaliphilus]MBM9536799.1 DegQ family serine endoprotease [Desulfobulbus alkaliphilus]